MPPFCHSDRSVSGVEESTTLVKEPTQDKTCCLGRFLDSHSFARNDMPGGGSVLSTRVIFGALLGDESSPLHCVVPFNRTGYIRNVAGGRLPPLRYICSVLPHFWRIYPCIVFWIIGKTWYVTVGAAICRPPRFEYNLCGWMEPRNVAAMIHRQATFRIQSVQTKRNDMSAGGSVCCGNFHPVLLLKFS